MAVERKDLCGEYGSGDAARKEMREQEAMRFREERDEQVEHGIKFGEAVEREIRQKNLADTPATRSRVAKELMLTPAGKALLPRYGSRA